MDNKRVISRIIGVDLGFKGAITAIDKQGKLIGIMDMPIVTVTKGKKKKTALDVDGIIDLFTRMITPDAYIVIEKTHAISSHMSNPQANWNLGFSQGIFEGLIRNKGIRYEYVDPRKWQNHFGINGKRGDTKVQAYEVSKQIFKNAVLTTKRGRILDGICDALLIAEWGRRRLPMIEYGENME